MGASKLYLGFSPMTQEELIAEAKRWERQAWVELQLARKERKGIKRAQGVWSRAMAAARSFDPAYAPGV